MGGVKGWERGSDHSSASTAEVKNAFNFCVSMHHYIWVYWDQLDANCLVLFYYTFFTLHVSDVIYIHPQERHIMYMQMIQVSARVS